MWRELRTEASVQSRILMRVWVPWILRFDREARLRNLFLDDNGESLLVVPPPVLPPEGDEPEEEEDEPEQEGDEPEEEEDEPEEDDDEPPRRRRRVQ